MSDIADSVERDVVAGRTSVGELGAVIEAAGWLADADVMRVDALGGKIPISWTPDGTVARIALPGGSEFVYLAIDEQVSAVDLAAALRGDPDSDPVAAAIIRQVAVHRSG